MRRLYIVPKDVYFGNVVEGAGGPATTPASPAVKHIDIFHPAIGSHYVELDNDMLLVSTALDHSEWAEETWHSHPEVARLPHPIYEGTVQVKELLSDTLHAPKNFKQKHLDCLTGHKQLGVKHTDTVLDVALKAKAIHPLVKLSNIL
jgi:hypothetical protein